VESGIEYTDWQPITYNNTCTDSRACSVAHLPALNATTVHVTPSYEFEQNLIPNFMHTYNYVVETNNKVTKYRTQNNKSSGSCIWLRIRAVEYDITSVMYEYTGTCSALVPRMSQPVRLPLHLPDNNRS
jgi:hypothetical protein